MYVKVLGAAAGGGFPQWNCSCNNCRRLRQGNFSGRARSQVQLAISADGERWFLLNCSPDLRYQIEAFPPLHPRPISIRQSPIQGVILTSAEADAALGLLLLRESQPFTIYATEAVRRILTDGNNLFAMLRRRADQIQWRSMLLGEPFELEALDGREGRVGRKIGIRCTAISTGGAFPAFVKADQAATFEMAEAVIGLFLEHDSRRIAFFPGAQRIAPEWLSQMAACDVILFDGTFWSNDELIRVTGAGKTAADMGHLPVGDAGGSLEQFSSLNGTRRVFIHINNTNPMLDEDSAEYARVRDLGWELAFDGMEL